MMIDGPATTARRVMWHGVFALSVALVGVGEVTGGPGLVATIALAVCVALWPAVPWWGPATGPRRVAGFVVAAAALLVGATTISPQAATGLVAIGLAAVAVVAGRVAAAGYLLLCVATVTTAALTSPPVTGPPVLTAVAGLGPVAVLLVVLAALRRSRTPPVDPPADGERLRELTVVTERARFALEMQDALGHHLAAATMVARGLRRDLPSEGADGLRVASRDVEWFLRSALAETRRVVRVLDVLPTASANTLAEALAVLVDAFRGIDVRIDLTVRGDTGLADPAVRDVVCRVVQSTLVTAARHPTGTRVVMLLEVDPGTTALTVLDEGQGGAFGSPAVHDRGALHDDGPDLPGLRPLAVSVGGRMDVSEEAEGTVVHLRVPTVPTGPTGPTMSADEVDRVTAGVPRA